MELLHLKVIRIIAENDHAATILLETPDGKPVVYQAGQFLTLVLLINGKEQRRSYSISSTPGIDDFLSITIKRLPNGQVSRYLLGHLKIGDTLVSLPPAGRFTIQTNFINERQIFFIAAGSGITPIFSLLKKLLKDEPKTFITLITQNHHDRSILFYAYLRELEKEYPQQLKWISLLSRPKARHHSGVRLTNSLLEKLMGKHFLPDKESLFYLCGPPAFMRMCQFTLRLMGVGDDQIKKEYFTVEFVPRPPLIADTSPKQIILHYGEQTFRITSAYPTSILQAALNNNIDLPYSCRGGRCSSCAVRCMKGKVKMSINEVLTDKELEEGWVLTCVGFAETDLELQA
jgi:ring-1,2-phenylacetyl-CoA epoxidase subunit PaaE